MEPCKVFRAKSGKGILIKIFVMLSCEYGIIYTFIHVLMDDETYSERMNVGVICIVYLIRIIGVVAGSLALQKVKKRGNDLRVSLGINTLVSMFGVFVLITMVASEELDMLFDPTDVPASIFSLVLLGLMIGTFPAFCSIALFDWKSSVKITKKRKRGIYIPSKQKLDI